MRLPISLSNRRRMKALRLGQHQQGVWNYRSGGAPGLAFLRGCAKITSHFAADSYMERFNEKTIAYCIYWSRPPSGRGGGRASAALPLLDNAPHCLRRGALHLPARRSRQNVNLFLRSPLVFAGYANYCCIVMKYVTNM